MLRDDDGALPRDPQPFVTAQRTLAKQRPIAAQLSIPAQQSSLHGDLCGRPGLRNRTSSPAVWIQGRMRACQWRQRLRSTGPASGRAGPLAPLARSDAGTAPALGSGDGTDDASVTDDVALRAGGPCGQVDARRPATRPLVLG